MSNTRRPETTFQLNGCSATIWKHNTRTGAMYNTVMKKQYKDEAGNWKESTTLSQADLATYLVLTMMASEWIVKRRAADNDGKRSNNNESKTHNNVRNENESDYGPNSNQEDYPF